MRIGLGGAALCAALALCLPAGGQEEGLVAHYTFNEGSGSVLHDVSGHGNEGQIHGARFVKLGKGYCLEFDGKSDYVDCGNRPSLDLKDTMALEAWVYPRNRIEGEAGILGKHFESYLLSYYGDGQCYWYITSGGNNAHTMLSPASWHHIVGTFDGKLLKLYLDGHLTHTSQTKFEKIKSGKDFLLGCVIGDPNASDPYYARTTFFPGMLDEVRVYNRALSADEVRAHFMEGIKEFNLAAAYQPVSAVETLEAHHIVLKVSKRGAVEIATDNGAVVAESAYSYPGQQIGWNTFSESETGSESGWSPQIRQVSPDTVEIASQGAFYRVRRKVTVHDGKVAFEDTLANTGANPVGLIVRNTLTAERSYDAAFSAGGAESPVIFLTGAQENAGVTVEDDISRLRFEPGTGVPANQVRTRVADLVLGTGKSYTLRLSYYILPHEMTYFGFLNQLRHEWNTVFPIQGPFSFFDIGEQAALLEHPDQLRAYLQRKHLRLVALSPWLDYDPGTFDRVWPRAEYKERMQKAIRALKAADPQIKCLGSIETDWVAFDPHSLPGGEKLPNAQTGGSPLLNAEQTAIVDAANLPWKDSVKRSAQGTLELELYMRGGKPQTSLSVYPALGNYQYQFLLGQVKFLFDEVGVDGYYIDEFSQAWRPTHSYSGWDGWSAVVDSRTGQIGRKYVDCGLAGIGARVSLIEYALKRGKIVVTNTYATSPEEEALHTFRFAETQGAFDPFVVPEGVEPPEVPVLYRGALATPIGLGIIGITEKHDTARRIMRALVTYLRHGMLYYHYAIDDIPATGPGSGEYGPINHMFPITPIGLHEGWIEGKERTLTCISGNFTWPHAKKPVVHTFDLDGREITSAAEIVPAAEGWNVRLKLRDWASIAVIEEAR